MGCDLDQEIYCHGREFPLFSLVHEIKTFASGPLHCYCSSNFSTLQFEPMMIVNKCE